MKPTRPSDNRSEFTVSGVISLPINPETTGRAVTASAGGHTVEKDIATMLVNPQNLSNLFTSFKASYNSGFELAEKYAETIAMKVSSGTSTEEYGWLASIPGIREWIGDRIVHNLTVHGFTITNRDFESTIAVNANDIADDRFGVFSPVLKDMGRDAAQHPDSMLFELLTNGFSTTCYDGQYFFDTDHPVINTNGATQTVSNMQAGSDAPWFLLDLRRAIKPLVWQERKPYTLTERTDPSDENVFKQNKFLYGVHGRGNAGYGLWQLAFGSKDAITPANYEAARAAMTALTADHGRKLKIMATHLVCGPSNEGAARRLLNSGSRVELVDVGGSDQAVAIANEWQGTCQLIVTPHLT